MMVSNNSRLANSTDNEDIINYCVDMVMKSLDRLQMTGKEIERLNYYKSKILHEAGRVVDRRRAEKNIKGIIFTFHARLDKKDEQIEVKGITDFKQTEKNYEEMIGMHYEKSHQTNGEYLWLLITNENFEPKIKEYETHVADGNLCIIHCDVVTEHLMFERATAARAISSLFSDQLNVVYLDGDAFPMAPFESIWNIRSDLYLTGREQTRTYNIMPINEGVIFASKGGKSDNFFGDYLKVYSLIAQDKILSDFYKINIKRWRGGQLSLNAIYQCLQYTEFERNYKCERLNCYRFNAMPKIHSPINLNMKYIVHIKGMKKDLDAIRKSLATS